MLTPEAVRAAQARILRATEGLKPSPPLLLARAAFHLDAGEFDEAAALVRQAQAMDAKLVDFDVLFKSPLGSADEPALRLDKARGLLRAGFTCSKLAHLFAATAAQLGSVHGVRAIMAHDRFLEVTRLHAPDDPDLVPLAAALSENLVGYDQPAERAIRTGSRREDLDERMAGPAVLTRMFQRLRALVEGWISRLPACDPDDPFLAARPAAFRLDGWSVVSGQETHHTSHIHPQSWANGVYYVRVPPIVSETDTNAGWLRVGPPAGYGYSAAQGWDERWIKPEPGLVALMPSHFDHESKPLGVEQSRICVAFQIYPVAGS